MKSNFFSKYDLIEHKSFPRDIKALAQMPEEALRVLPEWTLKAFKAPTQVETDNIYAEAAIALGQPRAALDHALNVAQFLMRELAPKGEAASDQPGVLAKDITELFEVPENVQNVLENFLAELKAIAQGEVRTTLLTRSHLASGIPILNAVMTKVDLRAVFSDEYKYDQDVSQFSPELIGTVPIGILELSLHGGETEKVVLQLSKRSLQILLDHLVALQKQVALVERSIRTLEE